MPDAVTFTPVMNWHPNESDKYIIDDNLMILRVGKWKVKVIKIVSDEEFERLGLDAPGWKELKEGQVVFQDEQTEKVERLGQGQRQGQGYDIRMQREMRQR